MSLAVERYELGPVGTNCYVVRLNDAAPEAIVVDPGDNTPELPAICAGILITHSHWDHLGGVATYAARTGAKVHMPRMEAPVLAQPENWFPEIPLQPYEADVLLDGGEMLELAGITFETLNVPGHSPGHLAYHADGALFSGDVLFAGSVGRTDIPYGDWSTLVESIRGLVERFPPETVVYSGHGPETTLGAELARNPFLDELRVS
jgi:glyoxylase-like metal-dependent hydrolase (beta-lactamase superfamily II)